MKRKLLLGFMAFVCATFTVSAQRIVSGKVSSSDDGSTIPGVNVVLKGTTTGTTTDLDGNYRLSVPEEGGTLVFSFIGLVAQEIEIGSRSVLDVSMDSDVQQLSEVVVTALGIERESRDIGYAISAVDGEELVKSRETNIVNSLQGKVTGVSITQSSGNLGGSTKILVRGVTSLTSGRNNPLWVVDGVPIYDSNTNTSREGQETRITGQRDFGNGAAALNPDDIESINVLKGAAATSLYGSRAAAGVIVVTTKRGKAGAGGKPTITVNSSVRFDQVFKAPDLQYKYGGGDFYRPDSSLWGTGWGPRIVGQTVTDPISKERVPLRAYEDNWKDFYETGKTFINNVSVQDASERGDYRLSLTSLNQTGILPNSELNRITAAFNAGFKHNDFIKSRFSVQYVNTDNTGVGAGGANDQNIVNWLDFGPSLDVNAMKPWKDESGNQINNPDPLSNNIFWVRNENASDRKDDRFIGSYQVDLTPFQGFTVSGRVGLDWNYDRRFLENSVGTITRLQGNFDIDNIQRRQINVDVIASYTTNINQDISLSVLGGYNYNSRVFTREQLFSNQLVIPELFAPGNASVNTPNRDFNERRLFGLYGQANISYKDYLTLTLSARNDWSSTLPLDNNSYFYPAVSTAFVFTDAFNISNNILSYGKFRASWAQVGNDTNPYQTLFSYDPLTISQGQYSLNLTYPYGNQGVLGFRAAPEIPNAELRPEEQTSIELGTELSFFNGNIGVDVTYFKTNNKDQILQAAIPESTGFGFRFVNAGEIENEGIEFALNFRLANGPVKWNSTVNFSHVESTVVSLFEGTDELQIASGFTSVAVKAVPGKEYQLFAIPVLRDTITGRPIVQASDGTRVAGEQKAFGTVLPDFTMGFVNNFSWKGLSLSFTIDWRQGGLISARTVEDLVNQGMTEETLQNREGTFIDRAALVDKGDGVLVQNDIPLRSSKDFWQSLDDNGIGEHSIFEATFVKLREVAISYQLPKSIVDNTPFQAVQFGIEGRNLALLYSKVPHIDPEVNLFGSGVDGFGIEQSNVPSTRSYGFNLKLTF
ncbi:MAG: SusC/RagA family TonB-linked outer membrane protein [Cyclobacteriaceae bacterium]|nr:SusC/RagA family TonB-linked outer membrane protein [Cyclobacteriaceae bacterium HetDA_MAG_MS6]